MKMSLAVDPFIPFFIGLPLFISALGFLKFRRHHKAEFLHLAEFSLSAAIVTTSTWYIAPIGPAFSVVALLPWIWLLRTCGLVVEDISQEKLYTRFHLYTLGFGGLISIIFMLFSLPLSIVITPFALAIGLLGLTFVIQTYASKARKGYSELHHLTLGFIALIFISRLFFPVLSSHDDRSIFVSIIDIYLLLGLSVTLYPLYAEMVFEGDERQLSEVLKTRNRQLLTHSGFSEYKILAAGLSHEVNNALTIINAKISRLIQNKSLNPNADLHTIQNSASRIVESIRKLREFIYPNPVWEVLELDSLLNDILDLYGQRLTNHGVHVRLHGLKGKFVRGKRIELEQVFFGLFNTSVEDMDQLEDKWISLSGKVSFDRLQIRYEDSSDPEDRDIDTLMESSLSKTIDLTDKELRLLIIKEILERHGGSMTFISGPHTSILLHLPLEHATLSTGRSLERKIEELRDSH